MLEAKKGIKEEPAEQIMCPNPEEIKIKIKTFQTVQKNVAVMGFIPNRQHNNHRQLSSGQIVSVALCSISTILLFLHLICVANSIEEYMLSIFELTISFTISTAYINFIFKTDKLYKCIEHCEKELNISKWHFEELSFYLHLIYG